MADMGLLDDLLTAQEMADALKVQITWVYAHTRKRGRARIPHIKMGKYLRFRPDAVSQWLREEFGA